MLGGETCNERSDVFEPFAKGWNPDREYIQAIKENVAEPAVAHFFAEITIGRSNYTHIDAHRLAATQALEVALLQDAKQHYLRVGRKLTDLVEKQRAAMRSFESAFPAFRGSSKNATFVTEEFGRQQRAGNCGAVHADYRTLRPRRTAVSAGATCSTDCKTRRRAGESPTMSANHGP